MLGSKCPRVKWRRVKWRGTNGEGQIVEGQVSGHHYFVEYELQPTICFKINQTENGYYPRAVGQFFLIIKSAPGLVDRFSNFFCARVKCIK